MTAAVLAALAFGLGLSLAWPRRTPAGVARRRALRARAEAALARLLGVAPAPRCWCLAPSSWSRGRRVCAADPAHDPRGRAETLARLVARVGPSLSPAAQAARVDRAARLARADHRARAEGRAP